jgi:acyl CoA:acetate/3-ketoacid CoA transferase alpha subunit
LSNTRLRDGPDYALIATHKADRLGDVEERIAEVGEIDAEHVVTPEIFADRILGIPPTGLSTPEKGGVIDAEQGI